MDNGGCWIPEKFQLHLSMLAVQFGYAGFHVVSRAVINMGISKMVFLVYRNILALLLLMPLAYFLEKKKRPPLTWNLVIKFFILAIVGITTSQGFYLMGLDNTSPTFASSAQNSIPALTFAMAAVFSPAPLLQASAAPTPGAAAAAGKNWTVGCVFFIGHCMAWSGWLVLQSQVLKKYPARLSFISYQCFFGVLQLLCIAAFVERDPQSWLLHSGAEIFSVFYGGVVASGFALTVQIWCIDRGGPVFVAVYQPVQTLAFAIISSFFLGEQFYLRGIIGAVLIIAGLYLVLWGKNEEMKLGAATVQSPATADHDNYRTTPQITQPLLGVLQPTDSHIVWRM